MKMKTSKKSIQERFENFHSKQPEVLESLIGLAIDWKDAGHDACAIGMLWEVLRWQRGIEGLPDPEEEFKLNDHYRSRYARMIMDVTPDLEGFFQVREIRTP